MSIYQGKKIIAASFKIVLTVVFFIVINRRITFMDSIAHFKNLSFPTLLWVIVLGALQIVFQTLRWKTVLTFFDFPVRSVDCLKTILWGNFLALFTPARFGELFRAVGVLPGHKTAIIIVAIIDKLFSVFSIAIFGGLFFFIQGQWKYIGTQRVIRYFNVTHINFFIGAGAAVLVICITYCVLKRGRYFENKGILKKYLMIFIHQRGLVCVIFSLGNQGALIIQTVLLFQSIHPADTFILAGAMSQAYAAMMFVSVTIGNMGVREGAYYLLLKQSLLYNILPLQSVQSMCLSVSILIFLTNIMIPAGIGGIWLVHTTSFIKKFKKG